MCRRRVVIVLFGCGHQEPVDEVCLIAYCVELQLAANMTWDRSKKTADFRSAYIAQTTSKKSMIVLLATDGD